MVRYFCSLTHSVNLMPFFEGPGWYSFTEGEWSGPHTTEEAALAA